MKKPREKSHINIPSEEELSKFYEDLNSTNTKPAILKITPPYSKQFIPLSMNKSLPCPLSQLYDPAALHLDYLSLLSKCEEVGKNLKVGSYSHIATVYNLLIFQISMEQVNLLEQSTRKQAKCKLWKVHHEGRITASNLKAVDRTNPCMPAESLIKRICYPQAYSFTTESTK